MPHPRRRVVATTLSLLAAAGAASAQPADAQQWTFEIGASPSFTFEADMDDNAGSVSVFRTGLDADFGGPVGDRARLSFGISGDIANYDFQDFDVRGVTEEPLDTAYQTVFSTLFSYSFDDQWYTLVRGSVGSGWAEDADFGEGVFGSAAAGLGYRFSENFSLALGGGFITRLEDNVAFLPLVVVTWNINDRLTLATTGVGLTLTAKLDDQWSVYLRGGGEFHQYRLDDDAAVAPGGVLNDLRIPIGVGFTWKPAGGLSLSLEGGAVVYQQFEIRDDDERELDEIETDPAAYVAGRVTYRF
ncbi:MAG: hypothetical protein J0L61_00475 [Planctomycetes bacterium]|nr:hypothetical protein [Planctomycetota bacterium]